MSEGQAADRVSVRTILEQEGLSRVAGATGMSESKMAKGLAALGGQSTGMFLGSMIIGKAAANILGFRSKKQVRRVFREPYPTVLRALAVTMTGGSTGLTLAVDTRLGAYLKGTLPSDVFSGAGAVEFDVHDLGKDGTEVIGQSEIKGQMYAWGKGRRALNTVLDEAAEMIRRF